MFRVSTLLMVACLAGLAVSQEPKTGIPKEEPKKPADAKKAGPKAADKADVDVQQTAERIAENARKAGDRLKDKDPGADTRRIQDEIVKDIDALLKLAQRPPPQHSDSSPTSPMQQPMGGSGQPQPKAPMPQGGSGQQPKSPMGGGSSQANSGEGGKSGSRPGRRPRRERRPSGGQPGSERPMANAGEAPMPARPDPKDGPGGDRDANPTDGDRFGRPSPRRQDDKLADLYKDVWGHLPDRMRQEMDLYYREKFMPRYSELLRRYYAALAEQKKPAPGDR